MGGKYAFEKMLHISCHQVTQIRTRRHYYTPRRMDKIQNNDTTKCWEVCGATGALIHCLWECNIVQPHWKKVVWFLTKLNMLLPYNPTIVLLAIYPNKWKTYVLTKTYI